MKNWYEGTDEEIRKNIDAALERLEKKDEDYLNKGNISSQFKYTEK